MSAPTASERRCGNHRKWYMEQQVCNCCGNLRAVGSAELCRTCYRVSALWEKVFDQIITEEELFEILRERGVDI